MILYAITAAVFVMQLLDWYSTRTILNNGGAEKNPIAAAGIGMLGVDGYLGAKTVFATALTYVAGQASIWLAVGVFVIYAGAMAYNWKSMP